MAATKSFVSLNFQLVMLIILFIALVQTQVAKSQDSSCQTQLGNLNVCAAFLLPGASPNPSPECCGALQAVGHDCICNTIRIAARLPAQCNLPALNCAN